MSKITYSIITALVAFSVYALINFFTSTDVKSANELFIWGFIALAVAYLILPTKPSYMGNRKGLRSAWYNFNHK